MSKTLYSQLQDNLELLEHRIMMIPRYIDQPDKWLGGKSDYSLDMIPPLQKQCDEIKAALRGIEQWRAEQKQSTTPNK